MTRKSLFRSVTRLTCAGLLAALALPLASAQAQKAKDTLRLAFADPIGSILIYEDSKPETGLTAGAVFDSLMCFDPGKGTLEPLLATSWSWVNDRLLEVNLRQDVKFHDGSDFSGEDVVYTLSWLLDPNSKLRFTENWSWIESVELVDRYKVRIHAKVPFAPALVRLAMSSMPMIPKSVHGDPARRSEFGIKTPIGTGPYKAEFVDANKGVMLVKNPRYPQASACKPAASIGRAHILSIPDQQTQIAQLAVGGVDYLKVAEKDQAAFLSADPRLAVTATQGQTFNYMAIDASGRSGNKPLADIRVRQALFRSIDRDLITKSVVAGGAEAKVLDELCFKSQFGCGFSAKPKPFDRAAAKALLAEAGYPDGFEVELLATPSVFGLAEALAGELRKIGVRAKVDRATFTAYRDKQRLGKQQILINEWSSGGLPDAYSTIDYFFGDSPRDYWQDAEIKTLSAQAVSNLDDAKRREIYTRIYDRAVEQAYVLPISTKPAVFVHTKELQIEKGSIGVYGAELNMMRWK